MPTLVKTLIDLCLQTFSEMLKETGYYAKKTEKSRGYAKRTERSRRYDKRTERRTKRSRGYDK